MDLSDRFDMVVLIGGVSHTGKTHLAQRLLEKYKIPYLSLDHLKMGLIRGKIPIGFSQSDSDRKISEVMWPLVEGIIRTTIENHQHLIIEGCYLPPKSVKRLKKEYVHDILECFLGFTGKYIMENFNSQILPFRNVIENRKFPEYRSIQEFVAEHDMMRTACRINEMNFFDVNEAYEDTVQEVLDFLHDKLAETSSR